MNDKTVKWVIIRFVTAILVLVVLVVWITLREGGQASDLKEALIENCETSPVRAALTEILEEEIKESHSPLTGKFIEALHITPSEAEKLISKRDTTKKGRIEQIEPSDCEAQYK